MDKKFQNEIKNVLEKSDMGARVFIKTAIEPVFYQEPYLSDGTVNPDYDVNEPYLHTVRMELNDVIFAQQINLTDAWVVNIILMFTLFDGWIEERYNLPEGQSFFKRYKALSAIVLASGNTIDIIALNCYRIIRILRNGVQHNLSGVEHDSDGYHVAYHNDRSGVDFLLEFKDDVTRHLFTAIISLIQGYMEDVSAKYRTYGHYIGMLNDHYNHIFGGMEIIEDDISAPLNSPNGLVIDSSARAVITNPIRRPDDSEDSIVFAWYDSERNNRMSDYMIKTEAGTYLLPEEIGITDVNNSEKDSKKRHEFSIWFNRSDLNSDWRIL